MTTTHPNHTMKTQTCIQDALRQYQRIALVFQGGGALGAYQAGVYHALDEVGCRPTWLSGVSIGAINCAIIAGNRPEDRLNRLRTFWQTISSHNLGRPAPDGDFWRNLHGRMSALMAMTIGQQGFFRPRLINPWFEAPGAEGATSYYDTTPLKETLNTLIDWDLLNDGTKRLSVGTVNLLSGNFVYFDTEHDRLTPDHIMASGALPPALPPVRIRGEHYWDGGIVSNTPLQYLLDQEGDLDTVVFQVDLFSARGPLPRDMGDVMSRMKDIMYSSRTRYNTDVFRRLYQVKKQLFTALKKIPESERSPEDQRHLAELEKIGAINIFHLIYQQKTYESHAKDYEFSVASMEEHWQSGYEDTIRTLEQTDWFAMPDADAGVIVHDLHRDANI